MPSDSDNSDTEYIHMMHEGEVDDNTHLLHLNDAIWKPQRDNIHICYKHAPWMLHDALEFTLQYSVTHICECSICNNLKEHILVVKAIEGEDSFTWKTRDAFEKDLVFLGWTIALTGVQGQLNDTQESHMCALHALNSNLECKNHCLTMETEALR
jgi:hypothetical protein